MAWLQANWGAVVAPVVVGILDLVFALSPSLNGNGILHTIYLWIKGSEKPAGS